MGSCIASWGDWLNKLCASGEDEEGGESKEPCCGYLLDTFGEWVSPTEEGSFMRTLLCPVFESESYKKLAQCDKLKKLAMTVGFLGFLICVESFFAKPWWDQGSGNDTEGGVGGDDVESGEADGFLPAQAKEELASAIY
ncbi:unnamed protein product [Notodromas monacha]|uniref:Uncharacterized protein n=1 Tax=Notodromas monacha TaxID=399045 RepID=A0A7R9GD40_9CRUS|nr:unnamed protein product [Notodromas monacha]CAG0916518.1 unnamed protein product [Notodromas monacha]